jgi:hypothetical protein
MSHGVRINRPDSDSCVVNLSRSIALEKLGGLPPCKFKQIYGCNFEKEVGAADGMKEKDRAESVKE